MNEFVSENSARLDKAIADSLDISRTSAANLVESGNCAVNGAVVKSKSFTLKAGDVVALEITKIPEISETHILPEDITLDIRYEDEDLLVVNKPRGMVVHPANGHYSGTLVNALTAHCGNLSAINGITRPGIVHRIDKDTSGLLLVAKNDLAHVSLAEQLQNRLIEKEYRAVVCGSVKTSGEVDAPIGRSAVDRKKMCVIRDIRRKSRNAVTKYEVIADYGAYTHLALYLITGRTHQIRVHTAYIGHPVAGDAVYGNGKPKWLDGQCLHAKKLGFKHPKSCEWIEIDSELPEYFVKMLEEIRVE